jgi:hypothetical protein
LPDLVATYQVVVARPAIKHLVVDREGLGADFLASLKTDYQVVTLLKANQYQGLASFGAVGPFEPLAYDRQGNLITEVALAQFELTLAETPAETLPLYVALVRDQRRQVPTQAPTTATEPTLAGLDGQAWWHPRWQASPLPAPPTEAKLIPIVSTHPIEDAAALVQTYKRRWPAQENIIRDFLIPLGLETNHGYAKQPVENSEFVKRQAELTQQRENVRRWRRNALDRATRAEQLYRRRVQKANLQQQDLAQRLKQERAEMAAQGVPLSVINQSAKQHKAQLETELAPLWQATHRAYHNYRRDWAKAEG